MNKKLELTLKHFARQKADEITDAILAIILLLVFSFLAIQYFWLPVYVYEWLGQPFLDKPFDELLAGRTSDPDALSFAIYIVSGWIVPIAILSWVLNNWDTASRLAEMDLKRIKKSKSKRRKRK